MAYKSLPWFCIPCKQHFIGSLGKASHFSGKKHKEAVKRQQQSNKGGTK